MTMNDKSKGNDSAFPVHHNVNDPRADGFLSEAGLTKREWFAGMALQGLIQWGQYQRKTEHSGLEGIFSGDLASDAYEVADAMIEASKK